MILIVAALVRVVHRRWRRASETEARMAQPDAHGVRVRRPTARPDRSDLLDRCLVASALAYVPLVLVCVIGWIADERVIDGQSIWAKPFKFALSIGLAGAATVWLHRRLMPTRSVRVATLGFTVAMAAEQALITMQAVRGVRSHFNVETPFDGLVFQVMGALISIAFVALAVLACTAMVRPPADPIVATVARQGIWLVIAAGAVGFIMSANGGHSVGGSPNLTGMPVTGWSIAHGDLRPAHFIGLHGLQLLIALAAFGARCGWTAVRIQAAVTTMSALTVVALVGLTAQALAGQPVTSASSLAVVAAAFGAAAVNVSRRAAVAPANPGSLGAPHGPIERQFDDLTTSR
jgi:hypothetical protein